jgi:hypothetical protein
MTNFANSIHDIGQRASAYKHFELTLASTLSRWIDIMPEATAVALAGAHAHVHADHAQLWNSRIPVLWDTDESHWSTRANEELVAILSKIENDATLGDTRSKLDALYGHVMPALLQAYSAHLATIDPRVDPATARILQTCINNIRDHIDHAHDVIARISSAS